MKEKPDYLDEVIQDWQRESPELETWGLGIAGRILVLNKHIESMVDDVLKPFGVQLWGFDVLASLRRSGEPFCQTPSQLMRNCYLTSGAITNRIDRLEQLELVERVYDREDRRSVSVRLTDKGRRLVDEAMPRRVERTLSQLSVLNPKERNQLTRLLRKLVHQFEG